MVDAVVGTVRWHELTLRKQHAEGLDLSWTGSLGALREDLVYAAS